MTQQKFLLLGLSNVGKTVYGAQLFGRIQSGESHLRFTDEPDTLGSLEKALSHLEEGKAPERTTSSVYTELVFDVQNAAGQQATMIWPDYAGEQLDQIFRRRSVSPEWVERIKAASAWMLMIRPHLAAVAVDGLTDPPNQPAAQQRPPAEMVLPTEIEHIELLQILMHVRDGKRHPVRTTPRLMVVLSCLDELVLTTPAQPGAIFQQKFPLLSQFIANNWAAGAWEVYGLSAQGGHLAGEQVEKFLSDGPDRSGYVLCPDGEKHRDLTLPIAWMLDTP